MARASGRAYAFIRWSGTQRQSGVLGEVGWAFEYNDRLGRLQSFYYGSTDVGAAVSQKPFWFDKCSTLSELVKGMSSANPLRPPFDEVKVFEVGDAQSELALQLVNQLSNNEDPLGRTTPLEQAREILTRYGVRAIAHSKGFNAPFLWYNLLPGRSVPVRKLPVHVFQLRGAQLGEEDFTPAAMEDRARKIAFEDVDVRSVGECVVVRAGANLVIGLTIAVDATMPVGDGRRVAERVEQRVKQSARNLSHVFIQVEAFDKTE